MRLDGAVVALPSTGERLLALLAIRARPLHRLIVATTLWTDTTDCRAAANLRTTLWRTRRSVGDCVEFHGPMIGLSSRVQVDLVDFVKQTRRLFSDDTCLSREDCDTTQLDGDLLPDWDEEWVLFERERMRQLRIHALEALCEKLTLAGHAGPAIQAGLAAVAAEPLRESAQRILIAAHLHEGNVSEARRQYDVYRERLRGTLGIEPSAGLQALVGVGG